MEFVAYITDEETATLVQSVIDEHFAGGVLLPGGAQAALASVSGKVRLPHTIIIDVTDSDDEVAAAKRILDAFADSSRVILVGQHNDVGFYRKMLAAGAAEYLVKPFTFDEFYTAILSVKTKNEKNDPVEKDTIQKSNHAKLIVVMGAHGGSGTSTLVANVGWILAEERHHTTALIDLDVHFGTLALALDVEPSVGFRDALESPARIDSEFMESALVKKTKKLSVLSAEENLDDYVVFNGAAIEILIESVRENRDFILVDAARSVLRRCEQIIHRADFVILVSELTVTGLRNSIKIYSEIQNHFPETQVRLVINKQHGPESGEVSVRDFEKQLGIPAIAVIPDEPETVIRSINEGLPIAMLKKHSRAAQGLRRLCDVLSGITPVEESQKTGGLLSKIGQFSSKSKKIG